MKANQQADRFNQLLSAATRVFIHNGYRRTTMADIAKEMGVAPGTVYLYVEGKEALFHLLARRALIDRDAGLPEALPVPTPPPGATLDLLREALTVQNLAPSLLEAMANPPATEPCAQFRAIAEQVFDYAYAYRHGINLIERSSLDWPDMAALFYEGLRGGALTLLQEYLERGIATGGFRPVPDTAATARFIVESIAWFAIHRHGEPRPAGFTNEAARATVIDMLTAAVCSNIAH